ncbi:hypothetical protein EGW08_002111, partial [Elysia chlorotica]
ICDSNNNTSSGIGVESSVSHQLHQQHPPETVVVNVSEETTRPKPPKRTKSQREVKRATQQTSGDGGRRTTGRGAGGRNSRVKSVDLGVNSTTCSVPTPRTLSITCNKESGGWPAGKDQQEQVLSSLPVTVSNGLVCRQSHVIKEEAGLTSLVVLPSQTETAGANPPLHLNHHQAQHNILHPHQQHNQHQHQQILHKKLTPTKGVVGSGLASSNGLPLTPVPSPSSTEGHISHVSKTASPVRPALVVSSAASGVHLATHLSVPSPGVQQHLLQRRHSVPLPQLQTLHQTNPNQQQSKQVLTLVPSSGSSSINNNANGNIIIQHNQNGSTAQVSSNSNAITASDLNVSTCNKIFVSAANPTNIRHLHIHGGGTHQPPACIAPPQTAPKRGAQSILTPSDAPASYESLVKENKFLKQALSEKIRSRQQQQQQQQQQGLQQHSHHQILHLEETTLSPSPSVASSSTPTPTPSPHRTQFLSSSILSPSSSATSSSSSPPQPTSSPASAPVMPTQHTLQFLTDDIPGMATITPSVKQECGDPYGLESSSFDHQYATYNSDLAHTVASLTNVCSGIPNMTTSCAGGVQVTMTTCDDVNAMAQHQHQHIDSQTDGYSILGSMHHHTQLPQHHNHMQGVSSVDLRQQQQHQQSQQHHLQAQHSHPVSSTNAVSPVQDTMIVQSAGGQFFQVLQPLQALDHNQQQQQQQQQQQHHLQVTSTNTNNINNSSNVNSGYYNYAYPQSSNPSLMDSDKQVVVERYLHQQHQYYNNNGYTHFLNAESNSYNMKSPDSGFQEPCLSPNSSAVVVPKETPSNLLVEGAKDKPKK